MLIKFSFFPGIPKYSSRINYSFLLASKKVTIGTSFSTITVISTTPPLGIEDTSTSGLYFIYEYYTIYVPFVNIPHLILQIL